MKVFQSATKRISSSAKYFYTKTVSNYNLEYANFETTQVSNDNLVFMVICLADISSLFRKRSSVLLYWKIFSTYN